eukprot:TRINITY_DN10118_c1_g1_i6.p1 TRINITY_DN10118_c1_g1~~TRINITY_DN10118_c1_g1_i6.p1  ORF type:complete len:139 (-),score=26.71 TRINITY_DN10118_c1_g1_i6:302-718(-)
MIFVIVAEALHALLERANQLWLIIGFTSANDVDEVTHLQFAYNIVIFCDANSAEGGNLKSILKWFESLLGLKINYGKCELVGIRLEKSHLDSLAAAFGCNVGEFPVKYLGLLLCLIMPKKSLWDPVVEHRVKTEFLEE